MGWIWPGGWGLPINAWASGGLGQGLRRRGESKSCSCCIPALGSQLLPGIPLRAAPCVGSRNGLLSRTWGLDEIKVPHCYWDAALCPVPLLPSPVHALLVPVYFCSQMAQCECAVSFPLWLGYLGVRSFLGSGTLGITAWTGPGKPAWIVSRPGTQLSSPVPFPRPSSWPSAPAAWVLPLLAIERTGDQMGPSAIGPWASLSLLPLARSLWSMPAWGL